MRRLAASLGSSLALALGCGADTLDPSPTPSATAGQSGASGATFGGGGGGGGGASAGASAPSGGTSGPSGGGVGGGAGGVGGEGGGGAGAAAGAGGVGGAPPSGGRDTGGVSPGGHAGAPGSAGSAGEGSLTSLASELDGFRLECPCVDANHFGLDKPDNCDSTPAVDRQTHPKKLGGDPNVLYDVKLRVRGNTEPNTYVGGKLEQGRFYIGGQTSTPGYTAYMLTVAEPEESYFFNHNPTTGHIHFLIDYEVVIPMRGGTTVTFEVNGGKSVPDGHGVSNRESLVVPGIPPAPAPFNGQLVQFDVVSVQPRAL